MKSQILVEDLDDGMGEGVASEQSAKSCEVPLSLSRRPIKDWALKTLSPSRGRGWDWREEILAHERVFLKSTG